MVNTEDAAAIRNTVERWFEAYSNRDIDKAMSMVVQDEEAVFFGSGFDERRVGWSELKKGLERDLSQCDSLSIKTPRMTVSVVDSVAWSVSDCIFDVTRNGVHTLLEGRLTMILQKQDQHWLIAHLHFSVPAADQAEGESFPES